MRAIFISYRREDTEGQAGRLFGDLVKLFGEDSVFMDVAAIEPGRDFRKAIDEQVASCGVLLALMGKNWLDARDQNGRRRLDDPLDFVRLETAAALKRDIPVVPVLVHGASMPRADQLPEGLENLAFRNAIELTHARWNSDLAILGKALSRYITPPPPDTPDHGARTVAPRRKLQKRPVIAGVIAAMLALGAGAYVIASANSHPGWHFATFPPPNAGGVAFTITPSGDPACASYDQTNCLWGVPIAKLEFSRLKPLVCGEMHRAVHKATGYEDPKHWCNLAKVAATAL